MQPTNIILIHNCDKKLKKIKYPGRRYGNSEKIIDLMSLAQRMQFFKDMFQMSAIALVSVINHYHINGWHLFWDSLNMCVNVYMHVLSHQSVYAFTCKMQLYGWKNCWDNLPVLILFLLQLDPHSLEFQANQRFMKHFKRAKENQSESPTLRWNLVWGPSSLYFKGTFRKLRASVWSVLLLIYSKRKVKLSTPQGPTICWLRTGGRGERREPRIRSGKESFVRITEVRKKASILHTRFRLKGSV